jgi:hypothetical protein
MFKKQINTTIIKATVATVALMISFLFFGSYTCSKKNHLRTVGLFFSYPLSFYKEKDETKIYNFKDTILIFYYSDYILYRLSPTIKFETGEKVSGTEPYFIYDKNNEFGFLFTSLIDSSKGTKFLVDSFLANRGIRGRDFDIPVDSLWTLTEVIKSKENVFLEKYGSLKQGDETTIDSIYYYYSKDMNKVEYSFSKKLDSIRGMKLFKARFLYNERISTSNEIILPKRELSFEMIEEHVPNPKKIIEFIKKFESGLTKEQ